ncbi:hypothetical protein FQR65_LT16049 [Abscondita terminalis]|nr:hypothetical protein FQR65_LT16049 [Abscondita terminalis]
MFWEWGQDAVGAQSLIKVGFAAANNHSYDDVSNLTNWSRGTVKGLVSGSGNGPWRVMSLWDNLTTSTQTDAKGQFVLQLLSELRSVFSSVMGGDISSKDLTVTSNTLNVTLTSDESTLDEVVVVGYGTQKKGNLTGAVSTINVKENLQSRPIAERWSCYTGNKLPAVSVTIPSGEVVLIQESETVVLFLLCRETGNPLILLDNVEIQSIQYVNPEDIESISVLKDAAASSIYGAKLLFGVILIQMEFFIIRWEMTKRKIPIRAHGAKTLSQMMPSMLRNYIKLNAGATVNIMKNWKVDIDYTFTMKITAGEKTEPLYCSQFMGRCKTKILNKDGKPVYVNSDGQTVASTDPGAILAYDLSKDTYTANGSAQDHIYMRSENERRHTVNAFTTYQLNLNDAHDFKFMLGLNRVTTEWQYHGHNVLT